MTEAKNIEVNACLAALEERALVGEIRQSLVGGCMAGDPNGMTVLHRCVDAATGFPSIDRMQCQSPRATDIASELLAMSSKPHAKRQVIYLMDLGLLEQHPDETGACCVSRLGFLVSDRVFLALVPENHDGILQPVLNRMHDPHGIALEFECPHDAEEYVQRAMPGSPVYTYMYQRRGSMRTSVWCPRCRNEFEKADTFRLVCDCPDSDAAAPPRANIVGMICPLCDNPTTYDSKRSTHERRVVLQHLEDARSALDEMHYGEPGAYARAARSLDLALRRRSEFTAPELFAMDSEDKEQLS